jgi:branched-chain amino acid transport system ATP-binding protein
VRHVTSGRVRCAGSRRASRTGWLASRAMSRRSKEVLSVLNIDALHVTYGGAVQAVRGVTMEIPDGKVVAVLGSNGAGKTTLLRTISGTLPLHRGKIESGSVRLDGTDICSRDPAQAVRMGLVQVPEGRRIFGRLTVEENLRAGGMASKNKAANARAQDRVYEMFPVLKERSSQRGGLLSGGEQQMLAIGRALMASPKLLLLDEPSLGLAPRIIGQIGEVIAEINRQGTSVLLVEQNATMALGVADLAYVLDVGEVSLSGAAAELAQTDEVRRLYLGHDTEEPTDRGPARPRRTLSRWTP